MQNESPCVIYRIILKLQKYKIEISFICMLNNCNESYYQSAERRMNILEHIFPLPHGHRMMTCWFCFFFFFSVLQLKQHAFSSSLCQCIFLPAVTAALLWEQFFCLFTYQYLHQVFKNKILSYSISISSKCLNHGGN